MALDVRPTYPKVYGDSSYITMFKAHNSSIQIMRRYEWIGRISVHKVTLRMVYTRGLTDCVLDQRFPTFFQSWHLFLERFASPQAHIHHRILVHHPETRRVLCTLLRAYLFPILRLREPKNYIFNMFKKYFVIKTLNKI